jgi:hypothetical protein
MNLFVSFIQSSSILPRRKRRDRSVLLQSIRELEYIRLCGEDSS